MKAGELCAGYGGLALALEEVFDAELAWASEFEEAPSKILAHHWPNVPNHGDMTKIDWHAVEPVEALGGGTPCQDLSHAGRRAGMTDGTRSNLWVNMREAIATLRPGWVAWENVRGAYSAEADSDVEFCAGCMGSESDCNLRALGRVLGDFSDLGYDTQWRGLRASDVGAPHARFRVFVLAHDTRGRRGNQAQQHYGRSATTDNWASLPHEPDRDTMRARPHGNAAAHAEGIRRGEGWTQSEGFQGRPNASISSDTNWGEYRPAIRRWETRLGRPAPRPTEPTGRDRGERLSPRFTEWMMGLPDGWITDPAIGISRNEQLKACGNGVVPQQAIAALRDMLAAFEERERIAA